MSRFDLISGPGRLRKATAELQQKWVETRQVWQDQSAEEFQQRHLQPLLPKLQLTLAAAGQLHELLNKAERACEDKQRID